MSEDLMRRKLREQFGIVVEKSPITDGFPNIIDCFTEVSGNGPTYLFDTQNLLFKHDHVD